jgi:hypothetical protein
MYAIAMMRPACVCARERERERECVCVKAEEKVRGYPLEVTDLALKKECV